MMGREVERRASITWNHMEDDCELEGSYDDVMLYSVLRYMTITAGIIDAVNTFNNSSKPNEIMLYKL